MRQRFKVGDRVHSSEGSGDVKLMGRRYAGTVVNVATGVDGASDGCCYVIHGRWEDEPQARLTLRQLWAEHIEHDDKGKS